MANQDQLQTIDPAALGQVSGGAAAATPSSDDQILTVLSGIRDSIQSLAGNRPSSGMNPQEMLMLMMIMQQRNEQRLAAAAAAGASGWAWQQPIVRYI